MIAYLFVCVHLTVDVSLVVCAWREVHFWEEAV